MSNKDFIYISIIILLLYIIFVNNNSNSYNINPLLKEINNLELKINEYKDGVEVYQKQYDTLLIQKEIIKTNYEKIYIHLDTFSFNNSEIKELFTNYTIL